jgi:hypothetical protein
MAEFRFALDLAGSGNGDITPLVAIPATHRQPESQQLNQVSGPKLRVSQFA